VSLYDVMVGNGVMWVQLGLLGPFLWRQIITDVLHTAF